ncbi:MAG: 7-cyano-7-deazaguanine synthase QueC [Phycisphaerales bacterium]|nr:7-cyano-7-deazaguanine synthase QueC [Hyphomonadaceae bacterium]
MLAMTRSSLVLFSAGQDSATCLASALSRYEHVETIGFFYGQRHAIELSRRAPVREAVAAIRPGWAERLGGDIVVDIAGYGALAESALTSDRAIEMASTGLSSTFVPARNLVFLTIAAAHAYRLGVDTLIGGMCETDFSGYPDCRRETLDAMQTALALGLGAPMRVETPLMHLSKAQTWALAHELGGEALVNVILEQSHTCYEGDRTHRHDWGYGCGACPACELRAKGWAEWTAVISAGDNGPR